MEKIKRKHQFQIRKVPLRRLLPYKSPGLQVFDVHSICLPTRQRKIINWASVNCDFMQNYEEEFNDQIIYSQAYQQLYSTYVHMREERQRERAALQQDIEHVDEVVQQQQQQKMRLLGLRDALYSEIETLRDTLTYTRDKNYNLRWEMYHQRGAHYVNINGYSFMQGNEMSYYYLLQMYEQVGNVSKGLPEESIDQLPQADYHCSLGESRYICCICYDYVGEGERVTILHCKHTHHCSCLKDWLLKQKICPICKQEVLLGTDIVPAPY